MATYPSSIMPEKRERSPSPPVLDGPARRDAQCLLYRGIFNLWIDLPELGSLLLRRRFSVMLPRCFKIRVPHRKHQPIYALVHGKPVRAVAMPWPVLDDGNPVLFSQRTFPFPQNIGGIWDYRPARLCIWLEPSKKIFLNGDMPSLVCFRDLPGQANEAFIQFNVGPIHTDRFTTSYTRKKADGQEGDQLWSVFFRERHDFYNFRWGVDRNVAGQNADFFNL